MWRQGDLLIVKVTDIPEKAVRKENRVLAEGEATGHMHELDSGDVYALGESLYFRVSESERTVLKHPEHGPIAFEPGEYKVIRQREYEPAGWRRVAD